MPSIISTKTSGGGGIAVTGDTSGVMELASANGTTAVTIDASQNVGIGTASPAYKLDIQGNTNGQFWSSIKNINAGASAIGGWFFGNDTFSDVGAVFAGSSGGGGFGGAHAMNIGSWKAAPLTMFTNNTERMRISSAGDLAVGQTNTTSGSAVGNTADIYAGGLVINPSRRTSSGSANCVWETSAGIFFRSTSSIKYKKNVNDAEYGLNEVMQLRPVTYQGKAEVDGEKVFGGFIAEEVDAIGLKEFVVYDENNEPDSLGYDRMVSLLTKAIQEQQAIITDLKTRIEVLEGAST
jgi:hypothetical protein